MAKKRERRRVEVVYVVGDGDEFADALEEALGALSAEDPALKIQNVSHSIAIDVGGRTHYSGIIVAKMSARCDSARQAEHVGHSGDREETGDLRREIGSD